jgi:hypothetical protein
VRLQLCQQKGIAYADFLGTNASITGGTVRGRFANLRGNLLNVVLRVFQVEQDLESLRFLQWVGSE